MARTPALLTATPPWWLWPGFLTVLALATVAAALFFHPGADEFCYMPNGARFGDTCAIIQLTGYPCPQCGMTRAFVHGVRGHVIQAFFYNPAGLLLFVWLLAGGVVGAVRLATRDPERLAPRPGLLFAWTVLWIAIYTAGWGLRLLGVNALPG